jgi:hypothetical protein
MASEAGRPVLQDPAARGFDGRQLSPVGPPAPGEVPSPEWLAQYGRAPIGEYAGGQEVVRRITEDGFAVPGDDPLYQYLGAHRVFAEIWKAQQEDQLARSRAMVDEARQSLSQLLAEVGAAGGAAVAARRGEDEAALKRFSAELDQRVAEGARKLRETMAEERNATTAAIGVAVAEALAKVDGGKPLRGGAGGRAQQFGDLWSNWTARGRSVALWAAVVMGSMIAGLVLLWVFGHLGAVRGGH